MNSRATGGMFTDRSGAASLGSAGSCRAIRFPIQTRWARPTFDGMAELWFDDLAALRTARRSAEWKASSEDEANFIDKRRTALFLTEEHEIER